ncbi:MAG: hypothetical protein NC314_12280 [Roseburia sp.]|nr:hypothetical protein [Roseburia sp.]MCM1243611.1 hypothetical protein [Roseburia sp.]
MNVLKKILYGILIFFMLCCGMIFLCAMNPELSGKIADTFHLGEDEKSNFSPTAGTGSTIGDDGGIYGGQVQSGDTADDGAMNDAQSPEVIPVSSQPADSSEYVVGPNIETKPDGLQDLEASETPIPYRITAPADVAGKNGYQPIQDENTEIDDAEADELVNELDVGRTGDGLTFDPLFYPYYNMLDARGQHLYRQIYANANDLNERFAPIEDVSVGSLRNIFAAVYNDHPELFWVDTAYSCKYRRNGQCAEIDLQFNSTADNLTQEKINFEQKAKEITDGTKDIESYYEKEKYVHDALIAQVDYAASAPMNQSAYSALVNGKTVCAGYARAYQYMLQQLRIPCYYCTGYAGESHAWNIVGLDDGYYNVDATWDDTDSGTYDYFNKSDTDYMGTHLRQELSVNLPPCNGTLYRNVKADEEEGEEGDDEEEGTNNQVYDTRRSLADLGIAPESSFVTLEDYYNNCYDNIVHTGKGNYQFWNVVKGDLLFQDVYGAYQTEDYRQGYMDSALAEVGGSFYLLNWTIESLQDGYYLITHDVEIR